MGERESGSRRCGPAALTSAVLGVDPCCSSLRATAALFLLAALSARKNSPEVAQLLCEHYADSHRRGEGFDRGARDRFFSFVEVPSLRSQSGERFIKELLGLRRLDESNRVRKWKHGLSHRSNAKSD